MFNLGFSEILIIAVLVLVFFGAERMPEIGRAIGRAANEFKRGLRDMALPDDKDTAYPPSPAKKKSLPAGRKKTRPGKKTSAKRHPRRGKLAG